MKLLPRIVSVLSQVLGLPEDQIGADFTAEMSEAWSSLAHLTIILSLEEEFGIQFTDQESVELQSVDKILAALQTRGVE